MVLDRVRILSETVWEAEGAAHVGDRSSIPLRTVGFLAQCWDRQIIATRIDKRIMRKRPSRSHLSHLTPSQGWPIGQSYVVDGDAFWH